MSTKDYVQLRKLAQVISKQLFSESLVRKLTLIGKSILKSPNCNTVFVGIRLGLHISSADKRSLPVPNKQNTHHNTK